MNPAQFWALEMQNQQNQQAQQQQNMQNIMGGLQQLAGAYSENKQLEAKASSYDDIGKILNTAMFSNNPDAAAAFGNLQKEKDPRKKVMGYEQLFSLVGPMSNMMMAQGRLGLQQQGQQIQQNAPFIDAGLQGARDRASGNQTFTGGATDSPANVTPVEPPLPQKNDPVTVGSAAGATPQAGRPLGAGAQRMTREDWEKMRADTMRLGNPDPGPYPGP